MSSNPYFLNKWTNTRKVFFYFSFAFIFLYILSFPISLPLSMVQRLFTFLGEIKALSFFNKLSEWIAAVIDFFDNTIWNWIVVNIGKIFGLKIDNFTNGSGDTTYDWLLFATKTMLAIIIAIVWFALSKKYTGHKKLYLFLLTCLRYYLATVMLSYGFAKVIQSQFPYPSLGRLTQYFGDSSPMGLAWTFMGYSNGYNLFTGGCEIFGGLLLFFRRTKTFGALFTMTVCTTIFVMNLCFDIPVKLFSFHLLLFATYIASDDLKRIVHFFFTNKPVTGAENPYFFDYYPKLKKGLAVFKFVLLGFVFYTNYVDVKKRYKEYGMGAIKPALYGIYNASTKIVNGDTIPLVYNDTAHWKQLVIAYKDFALVRLLNDSNRRYNFKIDTVLKNIEYYTIKDTSIKYKAKYEFANNFLKLRGLVKQDTVEMIFKRYDEKKFLMNSRGFNWINEFPFNR
jgi:hypothetical protein